MKSASSSSSSSRQGGGGGATTAPNKTAAVVTAADVLSARAPAPIKASVAVAALRGFGGGTGDRMTAKGTGLKRGIAGAPAGSAPAQDFAAAAASASARVSSWGGWRSGLPLPGFGDGGASVGPLPAVVSVQDDDKNNNDDNNNDGNNDDDDDDDDDDDEKKTSASPPPPLLPRQRKKKKQGTVLPSSSNKN